MKNFVKILTIVGLGAAITGVSFGQGAGPASGAVTPVAQGGAGAHKGGGQKWMMETQTKILGQLNLTADQQTQVKALNKKTQSDIKELRKANKNAAPGNPLDKNDPAKVALREKMKAIATAHRDGLMAILTPDQQKQYQALMKQAMSELKGKRANKNPQP